MGMAWSKFTPPRSYGTRVAPGTDGCEMVVASDGVRRKVVAPDQGPELTTIVASPAIRLVEPPRVRRRPV